MCLDVVDILFAIFAIFMVFIIIMGIIDLIRRKRYWYLSISLGLMLLAVILQYFL